MDLSRIFKAYDIRGQVPEDLDDETARRIGAAFAVFSGAARIAVGRDCRLSSPSLSAAFAQGATSTGIDVVDLGVITTDMVYVAAGLHDIPGAMITASHNPKGWNGIKLSLAQAKPVGVESGLVEVQRLAMEGVPVATHPGTVKRLDTRNEYVDHLLGIVDPARIGPMEVVVDGGNGVAGVVVPQVFARIPARLTGLFLDPDGNFPNHHPDPLRPENLEDLLAEMGRSAPQLGVAFDGDADRAFFVDDRGGPLSGSTVTAMVADWFVRREPGAAVVHNLICSRAVPETVVAAGGRPVRSRVGHSFIKGVMAETGAVFGGEHSGHYYFRDNFRADSGVLAMLVLMQVISESGRALSELRTAYEPYRQSGEINLTVSDQSRAIAAVEGAFADGSADRLDGLTIEWPDRWFNLRPSNTEPVLRLNVEADDEDHVDHLVKRVSAIVEET